MKINNIKINGFGNLKDKDIEFKDGINIVNGKNESGKSTLLKFIPAMFYGLAKTKNGKEISDLEKYRPWNIDEFSGKIYYTLDNNEKIEVYRDFNKKTCKIYNEKGEEITEEYGIDKSKQSLFFIEQTGITEDILMKTAISEQTETKLNKEEQNVIIQKISNVLSTGNDNISYKKALSELKDKQNEEVGTDRTVGRPINIVKSELKKYREKEIEIKSNMQQVATYEIEKNNLKTQISKIENNLLFLKELHGIKENAYLEEEKININKNLLYEQNEKISEIRKQEKSIEENYIIKKDNKFLIAFFVLLLMAIILGIAIKNIFIAVPILIISIICLCLHINKHSKNKKIELEKQEKILSVHREIEIIEKSIKAKEEEIQKQIDILDKRNIEEKNALKHKYNKIELYRMDEIFQLNISRLKEEIVKQEEEIHALKLKVNTIEITYKNVLEKLEELPQIEEKLQILEEQELELNALNNSINIAKIALEEAYEKMKENITPEFVKNLSDMIEDISDAKYKNVKFNDAEGLTVELNSGEYVKADKLSIGTIDQMYLSLRLASLKEVAKEHMPIILDEPFVYYDEERLRNILIFLNEKYRNNQIIIFTCADREIEVLDKENIEYNLVQISIDL